MSNHDKIDYANKLLQISQLKSAFVMKSIEYTKKWNDFSQTLNEMEIQALEQLMRINEYNLSFVWKNFEMRVKQNYHWIVLKNCLKVFQYIKRKRIKKMNLSLYIYTFTY